MNLDRVFHNRTGATVYDAYRVASPKLYRRAHDAGADSCDSTQPLWSQAEWLKFERAAFDTDAQCTLLDLAAQAKRTT